MLLVRPGVADLGEIKVSNLLDCLEKAPKPLRLVSESDEGYGREVVRLENDKGEWLDLTFRLAGPTALLESIQFGDGSSTDNWKQLARFRGERNGPVLGRRPRRCCPVLYSLSDHTLLAELFEFVVVQTQHRAVDLAIVLSQ